MVSGVRPSLRFLGFVLLALGLGAIACEAPPAADPPESAPSTTPAPPAKRILALDVNEPANGDFDAAFRPV